MSEDVIVVIGVGGMGLAIARREGSGRRILLADFDDGILTAAAETLTGEGHDVTTHTVDVSHRGSVSTLADTAAELGRVVAVVHTAGLSPEQATTEAILGVDLLGVAHTLDEFPRVIAAGGAGVVIASMAGYMTPDFPADQRHALAVTPTDELLSLPFLAAGDLVPQIAYVVAKLANIARVAAAANTWGRRGARINSISPGVISTPMGRQELDGDSGANMRAMIAMSATGRVGTPDDIAAAASFLLSPQASFVTGTDLLVDGGVVAAVRGSLESD